MITIKRYSNRKLYNTVTKQYITLDGIAELIGNDEDVVVIDHATGEDLTALALAQIILEQEKKKSGLRPRNLLSRFVRAGEDKLSGLRRLLFLGDLMREVDAEIERRIQALCDQKKISEAEARRWRNSLLSIDALAKTGVGPAGRRISKLVIDHGLPTHEELQQMVRQIETLTAEVETLRKATKKTAHRS
jgi:polyhydroxyalkanoate synthesis repressor PhaR